MRQHHQPRNRFQVIARYSDRNENPGCRSYIVSLSPLAIINAHTPIYSLEYIVCIVNYGAICGKMTNTTESTIIDPTVFHSRKKFEKIIQTPRIF